MFLILLSKVAPLYVTILIGFTAGKLLNPHSQTIAKLLFYIMGPVVVFSGTSKITIDKAVISLPLLTWCICCIVSLLVYKVSALIFRDNTRNILAFSSGSSSMGFFGLPVALALFDNHTVSLYLLCYVGMLLFENSCGFYIATQGLYTAKQCMRKLATLPASYAIILALVFSYFKIPVPEFLLNTAVNIRSTYIVLGMMLLGIAVANIKVFHIDWKLIFLTIIIKYVVWPIFILSLIFIDKTITQLYYQDVYKALILLAIIPISGTGMMLATMLNYQPDKIAIMLLTNTVIGLFYVPLLISLLLYLHLL
ncbi:permease [Neoehrlichia mikurensis]|uniref:Permease n=1 Tax=Neoehrlichia mikurensis TaxID=89586 RepID=A0A9Q9BWY7_9RICK|nr:AEC family transporter [Neoehrlichia mikurensis]QXK92200.1 permease [Neoehrlichia mikurensis]QXK92656.1 permease [Neoehrlichia mikurensis]QXK93893.1 permease [Neoehrlichia mikurensis]UTO55108.1 permease [Neoehrlichia mikurensis]UTO56027.1 permease [Neoehrlichia mikurensis]